MYVNKYDGLTHIGLADRLDISKEESKDLMKLFFDTFPQLKIFFDKSEAEGQNDNYTVGLPPTNRIRFFHPPLNEGELNAIGRESKNFPIQEANASMLKIALIKLRNYIIEYKFPAKIHLPVHDEILSSCPKDRVKEWKVIQEKAMCDAADMFLEKGLLTVDTDILDRWTK
jgi:DNA polymerase-1